MIPMQSTTSVKDVLIIGLARLYALVIYFRTSPIINNPAERRETELPECLQLIRLLISHPPDRTVALAFMPFVEVALYPLLASPKMKVDTYKLFTGPIFEQFQKALDRISHKVSVQAAKLRESIQTGKWVPPTISIRG